MGLKSYLAKKASEEFEKSLNQKTYSVVGVTFDGRQDVLRKYYAEFVKTGKLRNCELILENDNKFDPNAISVMIQGNDCLEEIGFISKNENQELRKMFDNIKDIRVKSMGRTEKGDIGISILVSFLERNEK